MTEARNGHSPLENRLLNILPEKESDLLLPHLEVVPLDIKQVLYEPDKAIPCVYFPLRGVASLLTVMQDGSKVEVATVGYEGMVGLPVFLGADKMPIQAMCQVPGEAARLEAEIFKEAVKQGTTFINIMHRYTQALFNQISRSAACNRLHSIDERCSRWLLMTHDRVKADRFPLTQEFLSQMLGVRRATVNTAAAILQKAGLITYSRGNITILDRPGLEASACECYRIIEDEYNRLLV